MPAQWSKLIFNATVNTVAALTGLRHDPHFAALDEPSDLGLLVRALMDEGKAVAAAAGVTLGEDPWEMNVWATRVGTGTLPSMLEDVQARRPTEVDMITGSLVREAHRLTFRSAARGHVQLDQGQGGVLGMKVCVVGCGAVGSLFAANLATLDDVEVWAYDLAREHVDAINRDGPAADGRRRGRRPPARDVRRGGAAAVRLRDRRDQGDAHRGRDQRDGACVCRRLRGDGAERHRQRRGARATSSA